MAREAQEQSGEAAAAAAADHDQLSSVLRVQQGWRGSPAHDGLLNPDIGTPVPGSGQPHGQPGMFVLVDPRTVRAGVAPVAIEPFLVDDQVVAGDGGIDAGVVPCMYRDQLGPAGEPGWMTATGARLLAEIARATDPSTTCGDRPGAAGPAGAAADQLGYALNLLAGAACATGIRSVLPSRCGR